MSNKLPISEYQEKILVKVNDLLEMTDSSSYVDHIASSIQDSAHKDLTDEYRKRFVVDMSELLKFISEVRYLSDAHDVITNS